MSLAATEFDDIGFFLVWISFFLSPVVLLSWNHADSFLALILSRNSSVASVVLLVPKYWGSWPISLLFFSSGGCRWRPLPLCVVARKSSTCWACDSLYKTPASPASCWEVAGTSLCFLADHSSFWPIGTNWLLRSLLQRKQFTAWLRECSGVL